MRKVFLAMLTVLSMLAATLGTSAAVRADSVGVSTESRLSYVSRVVPGYLGTAGIDGTDVSVTDEIPIIGETDPQAKAFFVFVDEECAGYLYTTRYNNHYISTFRPVQSSVITGAVLSETPFSLEETASGTYIITETAKIAVVTDSTEADAKETLLSEEADRQIYALNELTVSIGDGLTRSSGYVNVPTVTSSDSLSWAACVASVINYYNSSSFTANGVYSTLYNYYGSAPYCSDLWIGRGYSFLGAFNCYHYSTLYYEDLSEQLELAHKPILLQFSGGNVVVCKSFSEGSGGSVYLGFMDPCSALPGYTCYESLFPDDLIYKPYSYIPAQNLTRVHFKG